MVKKTLIKFLPFIILIFIFRNWFFLPSLSALDFPYFFRETLYDFSMFPPSWRPSFGTGFGEELENYSLGSYIYLIVSVFVNVLGLPWEFVYKVFLFGLFIFLSVFSSTYLLRKVLKQPSNLQLFLSALIFTANTYVLMVVDGGQMGVSLAYSITPLVLGTCIKLINSSSAISPNYKSSILAGLVLAVQIMFDARIALITVGIAIFYFLFHYLFIKKIHFSLFTFHFSLVSVIVLGLHAYWLLPVIIFRSLPIQDFLKNAGSVEMFRFLSFATFPQALSLLHPNWPENIFGKIYFMRSEFIVLPILAYSSLLFLKISKNKKIIFFVMLGLIGAFLSKGVNPPFEQINQSMFQYLPYMGMFRDSTKFYLLISLSFSILIPFTAYSIQNWLNWKLEALVLRQSGQNSENHKAIKQFSNRAILIICILYFLFLIRPVFLDQLQGTFKRHEIPKEYLELKNFIASQPNFSRTLWVPTQQRYNFYSNIHPAASANNLFSATNSGEIIEKIHDKKVEKFISNLSIQYLIVPYDLYGEIFVNDHKYNEKEYASVVAEIDKITWLQKVKRFGKIVVYETSSHEDHFWIDGEGSFLYKSINPDEYQLEITTRNPTTLIFAENYSPYWTANIDDKNIASKITQDNTNSFLLEKTGTYMVKVYFLKKPYYAYGRVITLIVLLISLYMLFYKNKKINET